MQRKGEKNSGDIFATLNSFRNAKLQRHMNVPPHKRARHHTDQRYRGEGRTAAVTAAATTAAAAAAANTHTHTNFTTPGAQDGRKQRKGTC
jgi:hypothetical protein